MFVGVHWKMLLASATLGAASTALVAAALLILVPIDFVERLRTVATLLIVPIVVTFGMSYGYLSPRQQDRDS